MAESANHQRATSGNERGWCAEQGTDLEPLAKALWQESRKRSETAGLAEPCGRYNIFSGQLHIWKRQYADRKLDS